MSFSKNFTTYKNLSSKAWSLIIAAEIFSGAFIIFNGRSSSKTKFKALSTGGLYRLLSSKVEKLSDDLTIVVIGK